DVLYYIPQREEEGYGLNMTAVGKIKEADVQLVITVDNGISAVAEIAAATAAGIDVIVTDHHQQSGALPVCTAVLDPHRADCDYPFKGLCGAGVVWKLLSALENDTEGMLLELYGDLAALGTMADIVPLVDENRLLVRAGLSAMAVTEREGLIALARVAGISLDSITSEQISFGIAPRINVTGRIASVDLAVELLLCQDPEEAETLAKKIDSLNSERKAIEADIVTDIGKLISEQPEITASRVLVVSGKGWHPGVIGITAARLVERYRKPCIVLTQMEDGELRGSARSVEGYSIIDAIHACGHLLIKYGGHPMAAGLSLAGDKLSEFQAALAQYSAQQYPVMPRHCLMVDSDILPTDITLENIQLLESLQPYGCGNPQPVPVLRGMVLESITPIGNGNHLRLGLSFGDARLEVLYFGMTAAGFPITIGTLVDCAVALSVNSYKGVDRPSIRIVSLVPSSFPMEAKLHGCELYDSFRRGEAFSPEDVAANLYSREELSIAFRLLRELSPYSGGADWLFSRLGKAFGYFRLMVSLDILTELNLISSVRQSGNTIYTVLPASGKANIPDAPTYKKLAAMKLVHE
ncbi:MAG: single-stranded-DNA-specific exonuclease RecJ, partial [Angelakisella sp.]